MTLSGTVNDGGGQFGINTSVGPTSSFSARSGGASSINFLRVGSGTTQITAGAGR